MVNIYTRVHHRKDTHESWSSINPVLLDGEMILVSIDGKIRQKVGDGINAYNDLPFLNSDVPFIEVTPEDAGKVFGVDENGNIALIEATISGGGSSGGSSGGLTWGDLKDLTSK